MIWVEIELTGGPLCGQKTRLFADREFVVFPVQKEFSIREALGDLPVEPTLILMAEYQIDWPARKAAFVRSF